jgi:hypothetical protein
MKAVMADTFMDYDSTLFLILSNTFKMVSCGVAYLIYALLIHERILYAEVVISLSFIALVGYLLNLTLAPSYAVLSRDDEAEERPSEGEGGSGPSSAAGRNQSGGSVGTILGGVLTTAGIPIKGERGTLNDLLLPRLSSSSSLNSEMMYVPEYF